MSPDQFTPESDQIPERALALIKKWRYLFEDDIPRRRWMHKGLEKIVYIPIDDGEQSTSNVLRGYSNFYTV